MGKEECDEINECNTNDNQKKEIKGNGLRIFFDCF